LGTATPLGGTLHFLSTPQYIRPFICLKIIADTFYGSKKRHGHCIKCLSDILRGFMNEINTANVVKGAVAGLIGGLIASFVMEKFQMLIQPMMQSEGDEKANEEEPSTEKAASAISENVFDHYLTEEEKPVAGEAVHYAMGGTSGMIFGAVSEIVPEASAAAGLPFGTAVWLIADDAVVPALGLSKPVSDRPLSEHAYALSSHLVYGLATDVVRRGIRHLW